MVEPVRLPHHYDEDGAWCAGSGHPVERGRCAICGTTVAAAGVQDARDVLAAYVAGGVRAQLGAQVPMLACPVPLDPEPEGVRAQALADPYCTEIIATYPGGAEARFRVTVEPEPEMAALRRARRPRRGTASPRHPAPADRRGSVSAGITPCPDRDRHSPHAHAGGEQWCEGRP